MAPSPLTFSVIIPTYNRPVHLARCLESLRALDYPIEAMEVIVVDDGGVESLAQVSEEMKSVLPLRTLAIPHAGPAAARNAGAHLAEGEVLAFVDDDCQVEPDWLAQFAEGFADGRWDALGGQSLNPRADNPAMDCWHYLIDFLYAYLQDERGNALLLVSNNAAYRRSVFVDLGGFDEAFRWAEDRDLSVRLRINGYAQAYFPKARVWHHIADPTAWGYLNQQFSYGRGESMLERKLRHMGAADPISQWTRHGHPFRQRLWTALREDRVPLQMWSLINLGQVFHRLGKRYEALRSA